MFCCCQSKADKPESTAKDVTTKEVEIEQPAMISQQIEPQPEIILSLAESTLELKIDNRNESTAPISEDQSPESIPQAINPERLLSDIQSAQATKSNSESNLLTNDNEYSQVDSVDSLNDPFTAASDLLRNWTKHAKEFEELCGADKELAGMEILKEEDEPLE